MEKEYKFEIGDFYEIKNIFTYAGGHKFKTGHRKFLTIISSIDSGTGLATFVRLDGLEYYFDQSGREFLIKGLEYYENEEGDNSGEHKNYRLKQFNLKQKEVSFNPVQEDVQVSFISKELANIETVSYFKSVQLCTYW